MIDSEEQQALVGEVATKICGFAQTATQIMSPDAVWTALLVAAVTYAKSCGVPESRICEHMHGFADSMQATEPPAHTVN